MRKGRKRILSDEDVSDIVDAFQINETLTKRGVAMKYQISLSTLYKYLPQYLRPTENFKKKKTKEVWYTGG